MTVFMLARLILGTVLMKYYHEMKYLFLNRIILELLNFVTRQGAARVDVVVITPHSVWLLRKLRPGECDLSRSWHAWRLGTTHHSVTSEYTPPLRDGGMTA